MRYKFLPIFFILLFPVKLFAIAAPTTPAEILTQRIIHKLSDENNAKQSMPVIKKSFPVIDNIVGVVVQLNREQQSIFYMDVNGNYYTTLLYDNHGNNFSANPENNPHTPQPPQNARQLVQKILNTFSDNTHQAPSVITQSFPVITNIQGFLTQSANGCQALYFADQKGNYYTPILFDAEGNNLAYRYREKYMRFQTISSRGDGILQQVSPDIHHMLFIFIDPDDPAGPKLYQLLKPYVDRGKLAIKWFLIANKPSSLKKADMIYQQAIYTTDLGWHVRVITKPDFNLAKNWLHYNDKNQTGGMQQYPSIPWAAINMGSHPGQYYAQIQSDTQLAKTFAAKAAPILIYRDKDGTTRYLTQLPDGTGLDNFINALRPPLSCPD